jgi:hypothetical protein
VAINIINNVTHKFVGQPFLPIDSTNNTYVTGWIDIVGTVPGLLQIDPITSAYAAAMPTGLKTLIILAENIS